MAKVYTKTGDLGQTSLIGNKRVWKDDLRVAAYGTLDELNSLLGVVRSFSKDESLLKKIVSLQGDLLEISAVLANFCYCEEIASLPTVARNDKIIKEKIETMEKWIDQLQKGLPVQKNFILPGGTQMASLLHLARTVCRRAEREVVSLSKEAEIPGEILKFLNRLSDLLYILALQENKQQGQEEISWT